MQSIKKCQHDIAWQRLACVGQTGTRQKCPSIADSVDLTNPAEALTLLDKLGAEGWELVTSFVEKPREVGLIFKREGGAVDTSAVSIAY